MKACRVSDCPKPAGVPGTAHGWCSAHYNRWKRTGDPLTTRTDLKPKAPPTCSIDGCEELRWARGWCGTHYQRWRASGDPGGAELLTKRPEGPCQAPGCSKPSVSGKTGYCGPHYQRFMKWGDPLLGGPTPRSGATCEVPGCGKRHYAHRLCHQHWSTIRNRPRARAARQGRDFTGWCSARALIDRVAYYGGKCWMCGSPADGIDHVKPLAAGGCEWPANLRPTCSSCNQAKWRTWPFDTRRSA